MRIESDVDIPKLEDIRIVSGFKRNKILEAESRSPPFSSVVDADYFKEFIERQRSRGY